MSILFTARTRIEILTEKQAADMLRYCQENREHLSPWEPVRDNDYLTLANWEAIGRKSEKAFSEGSEYKFVVLSKESSEVIGVCNFTGVVRGVFQACFLSYSIAKKYEGQGYMTEILNETIGYIFSEVGLNRIMANYMPSNQSSGRVLEKLGFEHEGMARNYLKICGKWEDHILTSKLTDTSDN